MISHLKKRFERKRRDFSEYATAVIFLDNKYSEPRKTRAIFIVMGPFLKKKSAQRFIIGKPGSACLNVSDACFLQKGKKDVYIFIFLSSFVLLEIKIFIICCFTFGISDRCDSSV